MDKQKVAQQSVENQLTIESLLSEEEMAELYDWFVSHDIYGSDEPLELDSN